MQIKIGFTHNNRELQIVSERNHDEVLAEVREFLQDSTPTRVLELETNKGDRHLVLREHVAYVEVGTAAKGTVGFL
ncbi:MULTISPECIES: DUF3107 domain-containing protein [Corynebacterium]|uniref:DUF3107 domain-containing protein n=1 Tax=Corynebacterium TaxID=1716 RepID=UPI000C068ABF|nr:MULTISPECIES: DUF3107 domain-containing protein [Corynebacterium]MBF0581251.1 DUF3107 domain-containing protein [Corynebacterium sp. ED61]